MTEKMFKYFSDNSTRTYIDVLNDFVHQNNTSKHRSIKMTPVAASLKEYENKVYWNLYGYLLPLKQGKFKVGVTVRIIKKKGVFEKGYTLGRSLYGVPWVKHSTPNVSYKGF